jgi:hypothetical protein
VLKVTGLSAVGLQIDDDEEEEESERQGQRERERAILIEDLFSQNRN